MHGKRVLQPMVRQLTGKPYVYHAYVVNRTTGKVVSSCHHNHTRRRRGWTWMTGAVFAKRCADRQLVAITKAQDTGGLT